MNNKEWSEIILKKFDPSFKHRWEVFNDTIKSFLGPQTVWVDCGCGNNEIINSLGQKAKAAIGIDAIEGENKNNFLRAEISNIPLPSDYADLITLRFVVEHFKSFDDNLSELSRLLKPGGKIVILTTNLLSPLVFIPRLFLPHSLKSKILTKTFKVNESDVFPTYHKLNTPHFYTQNYFGLHLKKIIFISDLNYTRKFVFLLLLLWHKITDNRYLKKFRTNILVILEKD